MPYDFDRFVYPRAKAAKLEPFTVPADPAVYQQRLVRRFPDEAAAIRQYFIDLKSASDWFAQGIMQTAVPHPVASAVAQWRKRRTAKFTQTTREYLDSTFKSEELKTLLVSQWPDYGLPPTESAFVLHAVVVSSYNNGAWFPQGGLGRISRTFEVGIEAHGGLVKVCHEVTAILTDGDGKVVGVKAVDQSGAEPGPEMVYHAPVVISNAGADITYKKLLPVDGDIGKKTAQIRDFIEQLEGGPSAVTLYLRLEKPVSTIGVKGENYWIHTPLGHDDLESQTAATLAGKPPHAYMSFPSTKSGDGDRFHAAEILAIVNGHAFAKWADTSHGMRGADYLDLKDRITQGLLDLAETATPGLKSLVRYSELSTPLSVQHYTSRPAGSIYGLKGTPSRYQSPLLSSASPIPGLYLSGSDASGLGVVGALMGGIMAASKVLGSLGFIKIMRAASTPSPTVIPPSIPVSLSLSLPHPTKQRALVTAKRNLTPTIYHLTLQLERPTPFSPGQFAFLLVAPFEWRSYSIASLHQNSLTLLISSATGGSGSVFIDRVTPGEETQVELAFGSFQLLRPGSGGGEEEKKKKKKVFVATGTGLAPFLPMFGELERNGDLGGAELLFGCRFGREDITRLVGGVVPRTTVCVSGEGVDGEGFYHGRVTGRLAGMLGEGCGEVEYYLCGSPGMVSDCRALLARAGAERVKVELY